jgi:hypothetical protein
MGWIIVPLIVAAYMLPTIIAFSRKHHDRRLVMMLNVVLGCTVMGWLAALIWALAWEPKEKRINWVQDQLADGMLTREEAAEEIARLQSTEKGAPYGT